MNSPNSSWDPAESTAPAKRGLAGQFWDFLWENKWWWITPTLLILTLLGVVIITARGSSVTPFIYALF